MKKISSNKKLREFGILLGVLIPTLVGYIIPIIWGDDFRIWTLFIGTPILLIALLRPKTLKYPYEAWMKFGNLLGLINSYIILGLVFFIILQPIAFIMKLFSYDPLQRKKNPENKTYREIKHNKQIDLTQIF